MRYEGSAELLEQQRRNAARMFKRDFDANTIAELLEVHPQTVRAWRRQYDAGGLEALSSRPHPGPPCRLDDGQKQQLLDLLAHRPSDYGYDHPLWTTRLIARLIKDQFDVTYHHNHVGVMLRQLGYSYQKPAKRAAERDEQKIQQWREGEWPTIAQGRKSRKSTVIFVDEAGFSMIPSLHKTWAPRGETPIVEHRNRWHRKVSVIGGLSVSADRKTLDAVLDWYPGENVDQPKVLAFLGKIAATYEGPIDIVWDNLSSHKGKAIHAWLATHRRVRLHYLPPYAPELNPIEMLWSLSKYHRLANHGITDLDELHERAVAAVDDVAAQQQLLRSCVDHARLSSALWPSGGQ